MSYTIYETFVGAGGSHIGFKNQGFITKYVNDINDDCLKTLIYNNPEIQESAFIDNTDILNIDPHYILEKTNMKQGELDVLFGGIVCKGFSLAGERCPNDERSYFYHKQLELVECTRPKMSIIENVPGILNAEVISKNTPSEISKEIDKIWKDIENYKGAKAQLRKINKITPEFEEIGIHLRKKKELMLQTLKDNNYLVSVMDDIKERYETLGYTVKFKVLNSAMYGAATRRERVIIVAIRNDVKGNFVFPEPTHIDDYLKSKYPNEYSDSIVYLPVNTVNDALKSIDYLNRDDVDNIAMKHHDKTIERFKYIPVGDNISNYIDNLPSNLKISKFYSRGNTMRLAGDKPSPTLVPGHSNFSVHPTENRSITVREAACITGFPIDYKFFGSHTKRCEHVGNAVTPPLSEAIARAVKKLLHYQT